MSQISFRDFLWFIFSFSLFIAYPISLMWMSFECLIADFSMKSPTILNEDPSRCHVSNRNHSKRDCGEFLYFSITYRWLILDIVVTLNVLLVFSDAKTHEKTQKPRLAWLYRSQRFMGRVIYERFTVLAFSDWNRNLFHLQHICGGLALICSRLNALDELERENKSLCVSWEAFEIEKQLLNLINETEVLRY